MRNRPGERARQELRRAWFDSTRRNLRPVAVAILIGIAVGVVIQQLPVPEWVRAYELGLLTAGILGAMGWSLYLGMGRHHQYLGKEGEELTAVAVLGWRRRLTGWRLINGLSFRGIGDVDHILVGPGGIFAIESKYTTVPWEVDENGVYGPQHDPVLQARLGKRKVESTLRSGKDRFEIPVQSVLVIWGRGCPDIEGGWIIIDGTIVADGYRKKTWLQQLSGSDLPRATVRSVTKKLSAELAARIATVNETSTI